MRLLRIFSLLSILLIFGVNVGFGTIIAVPGDYTTIQEAIDAAVDSDTVLVDPCVYDESIDFLGKDIVVTSQYIFTEDSTDIVNTIIDGTDRGAVVNMTSGETEAAVLMGFTLRNGNGAEYVTPYGTFEVGGGVYLMGSSPTIQYNVLIYNIAHDGGAGLFTDGGDPIIQYNVFQHNSCITVGCGAGMLIKNCDNGYIGYNYIQFNMARHAGGIALKNAHPEITRNVISNNAAVTQGGGIWMYDGSSPSIINNTISDNDAPTGTGGGVLVSEGAAPEFMNNIISFTECGGGFVVVGIANPVLSYNLFYDNIGGDYINCPPGLGDQTGDPAYVDGDPFDFHLTAASAAIDMGNPDPIYNDPDNTRNDAGAFYYDQGPPWPVLLSSFSGNATSEGIVITWSTATEINCYGWYVERSLNDGNFEAVSPFIEGYGNSSVNRDYRYVDGTIQCGNTYDYRLKQIDVGGAVTYSDLITVTVVAASASEFTLHQNYPNPFNPETAISYTLPNAAHVRVAIYDATGRFVEELVNLQQVTGLHSINWNAQNLPSGSYICLFEADGQRFSQMLTLVK